MTDLTDKEFEEIRKTALAPRPECLTATDVAYFDEAKNQPAIQKHLAHCIFCHAMLKNLRMIS